MFSLVSLTSNAYYIDSPSKIGIVKTGPDQVVLIDSGNNKDAGKRALKILDAQGWQLQAVYNTHFHADHIGGNRLLQERTGCAVYAPGAEQVFVSHPELEPSFLYGAAPPKPLQNRFLLAEASDAQVLTDDALPANLTALPLTGHTPCMTGFLTSDGVLYAADSLCGETALSKYRVFYLHDVAGYLATLDRLEEIGADWFVPSHAPASQDIGPLIRLNREAIDEIAGCICQLCREPLWFDELLAKLFYQYQLKMDMTQYALVGSAVHAYLAWLMELGRITADCSERGLRWKKAD